MLDMDLSHSIDQLEQQLLATEEHIARLRLEQAELVHRLDMRLVHRVDGQGPCKSGPEPGLMFQRTRREIWLMSHDDCRTSPAWSTPENVCRSSGLWRPPDW